MKKIFLLSFLFLLSTTGFSQELQEADDPKISVRLKDIAKVVETRDNQLMGYGLVVGLRNTGDSARSVFTQKALTNLLRKMGITPEDKIFKSRNVASVIVTGILPPYVRKGQRISIVISSLGDATSLNGGTLLMTPLQGADFKTYAVAQGTVVIGGVEGPSSKGSFVRNQTTVGRIPDGAIEEQEVPVTRMDSKNIHVVLNQSNFTTASRVSASLVGNGFDGSKPVDATTIKVPLSNLDMSYVDIIAKIEDTQIVPDASSKIIINARTGTVVIGEMVRLFPVAITHGNISVKIEGEYSGDGSVTISSPDSSSGVEVSEGVSQVIFLDPQATLSGLVDSLNQIGVNSKDMISILQALKESGALVGQIVVI